MRPNLVVLSFALLAPWLPAQGATINLLGTLGDPAKDLVASHAAHLVGQAIEADRTIDITVNSAYLGGGTGTGGITAFDADNFPVAGTVTIGNDLGDYEWYVDPTPWDNSEFELDPTSPDFYINGPPGLYIDLLSCLLHEMLHAAGMHASPFDLSFNPRYLALMTPASEWVVGQRIHINLSSGPLPMAGDGFGTFMHPVNELSHLAVVGTEGIGRMLMSSPRAVNIGKVVRALITDFDGEIMNRIHDSYEENPTAVPEASTLVSAAAGLLLIGLTKFKKLP